MEISINPHIKNYWELPRFHEVTYNPFAIEVAMHSRGMEESDLAGATGYGIPVIEDLIAGTVEATDDQVRMLSVILDYPVTFFSQWFESRVAFGPIMGRNLKIDYSKYRIMMYPPGAPRTIGMGGQGKLF